LDRARRGGLDQLLELAVERRDLVVECVDPVRE